MTLPWRAKDKPKEPARTSGLAPTWPVLVFLASASLALVSALGGVEIFGIHLVPSSGFFDLRIYRGAAKVVIAGGPLYAAKFQLGFGFTYPPIAALTFLPLAFAPFVVDEIVVAVLNVALVVVIADATLRFRRASSEELAGHGRARAVWLLAAVALWTEPVISAIGYGQIDLLIAALVLMDVAIAERTRFGGLGIGFAAALKLTPLIFIPYLALTGRTRMATRACGVFALTIVLSFALEPRDAWAYWGGALFDTSRITGQRLFAGRGPANQSLRGALLRIAPWSVHQPEVWLLACVLVGGTGLLLAVRAARRGDEQWGFVLTAVTGLLISPVSWTHHWVIAVPGALLSMSRQHWTLPRRLLVVLLALASSASWIEVARDPEGAHLGALGFVLGDLYVLAGLGTIVCAGLLELRQLWLRAELVWRTPVIGDAMSRHPSGSSRRVAAGDAG